LPSEKQLFSLLVSNVTQILNAIEQGDPKAAEKLLPLVYDELRQLAAQKLAQEKPGQTLQATALVHEAYLKVAGAEGSRRWKDSSHFFRAAAEAMRRILVDRARQKQSLKRGGACQKVDLDSAMEAVENPSDDLVALDEALEILATEAPDKAELVKLRYFGGLTVEQASEVLGISRATADRHWHYAKTWLYTRLTRGNNSIS
jgi:RNA polymerase sigma factor (TIGR02999 family)